MSYRDKVIKHLESYEDYDITEDKKGYNNKRWGKKYYHIIKDKENDQYLNIFPEYREEVKALKINIHRDFHHLNSSQAMCINFFQPLIHHDLLEFVLKKINPIENWGNITDASYEKDSQWERILANKNNLNPRARKPTEFDFYIETDTGKTVTFEVKYSENNFGGPSKEDGKYKDTYIEKFNKVYQEMMSDHIIKNNDTESFLDNYQIMRNLVNILDKNHYAVFLVPMDNEPVAKKAVEACNWVTQDYRDNVKVLYLEDIVNTLINEVPDEELRRYYQNDFSNKYLNI